MGFALRLGGIAFVLAALLLCAANVVGTVRFRTIENDNPHLLEPPSRTVSEQQFWAQSSKQVNESDAQYVERLARLISNRMLLVDPQYAKPTFFENYILWALAEERGYHEWADTRRAIRLGGGFCSQHAIVFDNIMRERGIESRIIGASGHVLNEVLLDGRWRLVDPSYGITFAESIQELEDNPERIYRMYRQVGLSGKLAAHNQRVIATSVDNWNYRDTRNYHSSRELIERVSLKLTWALPAGFALLGIAALFLARALSHNERQTSESRLSP